MERTPLRNEFFAQAQLDPYAHMVSHLYADAWASGYEQALREHGLEEQRREKSFGERREDALEYLTEERRKSEAEMVIALAQLGRTSLRRLR